MFNKTWIILIFLVTLTCFVRPLLSMSGVTQGETRVAPIG
jgi:hypothetical protein